MGIIVWSYHCVHEAIQKGAPSIFRNVKGIIAGLQGISSVDSNPTDVQSPTPGHGGSGPPGIKVTVHPNEPTNVPMMEMEVGVGYLRDEKE